MDEFFPALLSRRQAMAFTSKGRKAFENMVARNGIRSFKTKGGHNRYHKADIEKAVEKELTNK
jgi:hypothetical protein